jgi:hypothetical protein
MTRSRCGAVALSKLLLQFAVDSGAANLLLKNLRLRRRLCVRASVIRTSPTRCADGLLGLGFLHNGDGSETPYRVDYFCPQEEPDSL